MQDAPNNSNHNDLGITYHEKPFISARKCVIIEHVSSTIAGKTGRPEGHQKSENLTTWARKNQPSLFDVNVFSRAKRQLK